MADSSQTTTLFEDWRERLRRLQLSAGPVRSYDALQIKVLKYLTHRYVESASAQRPARFFVRAEFVANDRRIVVHQHLGRGQVAGVRSNSDAERRMASILHRMATAPGVPANEVTPETGARKTYRLSSFDIDLRREIARRIKAGHDADDLMRAALDRIPRLSRAVIEHLCERASDTDYDDDKALDLLLSCDNESVLDCAVTIWRTRVAKGLKDDPLRQTLEEYVVNSDRSDRVAERVREELADDNPQVRLAAIFLLKGFHNLDDIGLFSDLLALPESEAEAPGEREAMVHAMRDIAENADT